MKSNSKNNELKFVSQIYPKLEFVYVFDQNIKSSKE